MGIKEFALDLNINVHICVLMCYLFTMNIVHQWPVNKHFGINIFKLDCICQRDSVNPFLLICTEIKPSVP